MSEPSTELTTADYDIDTSVVLRALGVDPSTVREGTVQLQFVDNHPVITYTVIRAVPAKLLAAAFAQASGLFGTAAQPEEAESETLDQPRTRAVARKTVKKAAKNAQAKSE